MNGHPLADLVTVNGRPQRVSSATVRLVKRLLQMDEALGKISVGGVELLFNESKVGVRLWTSFGWSEEVK